MNIRKRIRTAGLAAILGGVGLIGGTVVAQATAPPNHQVTICHATGSQTNPYVQESVDIASIESFVSNSGHGASGINAGDIIPPFTYAPDGFSFPGQGNQAILANGCNAGAAAPTPTPIASAPTLSPSSSPSSSPSAPGAAGVNPTQNSSPPTATGSVLGESLAATGSSNAPFGLGLLLVLAGMLAMAAAAITVRRSDA